jgi:hypothetical protein
MMQSITEMTSKRQIWEAMLEHQQAVTRASHFWAETDSGKTWSALNEAANAMLKECVEFHERWLED